MTALAHDSWLDLAPDEREEDARELSVREEAALVAVIAIAIPVLFVTSVLQVAYDALTLIWALFGLPLIRLTRRLSSSSAGEEWVGLIALVRRRSV